MNEAKSEGKSQWRRFSEEIKQDAVRLMMSEEYSFKAAVTAVGVRAQTRRYWQARLALKPAKCSKEGGLEELRAENKRLRPELRRAELKRAILKKATAIFAKE